MSVDGVARPLPDPFLVRRDAEPDRVRGHLSAARSATRPVPRQDRRRLSRAPRTRPRCCGSRTTASRPRRSTTCSGSRAADDLIEARDAGRRDDRERRRHHLRRRTRAATRASSRASRWARARAPRCTCSRRPRRRRGSPAVRSSSPTTSSRSRPRFCGTGCSCAPKPSSSATRPTTRSHRDRRGADPPMSPTPRAALVLVALSLAALVPPGCRDRSRSSACSSRSSSSRDAWIARRRLRLRPPVPRVVARGVAGAAGGRDRRRRRRAGHVRQANAPDFTIEPADRRGAARRQRSSRTGAGARPAPGRRAPTGPLGLAAWTFDGDGAADLLAYPDVPAAQRTRDRAAAGRFREPGRRTRGPLGLGTEFESVRDYLPDDDVRQINWLATERTGRPMSNQYRIEQDRDVMCLLDAGRLMSAPIGDARRASMPRSTRSRRSRSSPTRSATGAVSSSFDREIRRRLATRRSGGRGGRAGDPRRRAAPRRQRLRPRVPSGRRRASAGS